MKKTIIFLGAMTFALVSFAQKKNIQSASNSLRHKEYKEGLEFINEAIKDPSTKNDPKAWYVRGSIHLAMDQDPGYADQDHYVEAVESFKKVMQLKPGYEQQTVSSGLTYGAYKAYNNSVQAYNAKEWDKAYRAAEMTVNIHGMADGKNFSSTPAFDTVAAGAMVIQAYSAFYNEETDKALPVLLKLKDSPIEGDANVYLIIADVYRKQGKQAEELAIIEEAKAKYPGNANVRNEELNYYIRTNQQEELIKKLEAAVSEEPSNAVYQYNLANAYTNMAFPKDKEAKPANFEDLLAKAEAGFNKALELDPDNVGYHYDIGVLYFNQASQLTDQMNDVPVDDEKTFNELKVQRDAMFAKALPHLEAVYNAYESKVAELDADNKFIYQSSLKAMREIYARQDKLEKSAELKKKLEESMQ